jgi:hypothetical protein
MKPERCFIGKANVSKTTFDTLKDNIQFEKTENIHIIYDAMHEILYEYYIENIQDINNINDIEPKTIYYYDKIRDLFISRTDEYWFLALRINYFKN